MKKRGRPAIGKIRGLGFLDLSLAQHFTELLMTLRAFIKPDL